MGEQRYILKCGMAAAVKDFAREFALGRYRYQYKVVADRERKDSGRVVWRLRHNDPDFLLGSLECVPGPDGTTNLFVEDPPHSNWHPVGLEEAGGDFDRMIELSKSRRKEAEAKDKSKRSIQSMLVEDLLDVLGTDYGIQVSRPAAMDEPPQDWLRVLADGLAAAPWEGILPLSLEDVEAACHEHLAYLSSKRFSTDWDVQVWQYKEREGIAIRYDIQSMNRIVGHLRVRRIGAQQTQLEVTANPNGNEADEARLRQIMAVFADRWLAELPARPDQTNAIELANAAISNSKEQFEATAADVTAVSRTDMKRAFDEFKAALLEMGYSADRVERALEELRREEEERVERSKPVAESGETQYLNGVYIEPSTQMFGGRIEKEPYEVVMNRLLPQLSALIESEPSAKEGVINHLRQLLGVDIPILPHLSRKKPGRRPDPENDIAYQMILNGGGTKEASDKAYAWWCGAKNIQRPTQKDRDNFNQAMKRAAERFRRGQPSAK